MIIFDTDRGGNHEINTMDLNGNNLTRLTSDNAADNRPVYNASGDRIYFESLRAGGGITNLYSMDVAGRNVVRVTNAAGDDLKPDIK